LLEAAGVVHGLIGDEARVRSQDGGVLLLIVVAAGTGLLDLSAQFRHQSGALWEGDLAAGVEELVELSGGSLSSKEGD
jgi:hypothetical protein